jgi:hypothetical protein
MKLKEVLAEWLERTELFEMAYARRDAWRIVSGLSHPLAEHVVKVLVMPDSGHTVHWKSEIYGWLKTMRDIILKPQNRRLTFNEYKEWIINQPEPDAIRAVNDIRRQYKNEKIAVPVGLEIDFQHYMLRMCTDLANNSLADPDEYFK